MELDRYAAAAAQHSAELQAMLAGYDRGDLVRACRQAGADTAYRYLLTEEAALLDFLRLPPSRWHAVLARRDAADGWPLFLLGAVHRARWAAALLQALCDHGVAPGLPYRTLTAQAAAATAALDATPIGLWPFDDGEDPFGEQVPR